jgi:uncharacterized protein (DUF924 family)
VPEKSNPDDPRAERVLTFWFADSLDSAEALRRRVAFWFGGDTGQEVGAVDRQIEQEFRADMERAAAGEYASWSRTPRGRLALILLLDQFPRNVFRGTARAFATDPMALALVLEAMERGIDALLQPAERLFFYLPLEHAENIEAQERGVAACAALALDAPAPIREYFDEFTRYAEQHRDIIRRFGRFPHRNAILGRQSTAVERDYLARESVDFGQKR